LAHLLFILAPGLLLVAHASLELALFLNLPAGKLLNDDGPFQFVKACMEVGVQDARVAKRLAIEIDKVERVADFLVELNRSGFSGDRIS
jgi:hypothetical protein